MPPAAVFGRDAELGRLLGLVRESASGRGRMALVEGEPGIGKSSLIDLVAAECGRLGMRVLRGAAEEMERQVPFAAISSCLGAGRSAVGESEREFAVTEKILNRVEQWCAAGPVALLLDDLQWADPASQLVLHRLGRMVGQLPLVIVAACRPLPRDDGLERLLRSLRSRGAVRVHLGPLSAPAVAGLVERLADGRPGSRLLELVEGAAGNPLYIGELVAALDRDGWIRVRDGAAELSYPASGPVPRSLPGAIAHRLDFLSAQAREVLQVTAVLGPYLRLTELSVILNRPASTLLGVVHEAVAGGLLTESGDQLVFRHDLIREALAGNVPPAARAALNLQAARALAASGAPAERVAYYFIAGHEVDAALLAWLERAADPLVARAPAVAVDLLERAVSHTGLDDPRAEALRYQLARALLWAGRPVDAEWTARAILAGGHDPTREGALRWLLARACFQQWHLRNAEAVAEDALAAGVLTTAEAARFRHFAGLCRFTRGEAVVATEEAAALALLDRDDPDSIAYGTYHLGGVRYMQGYMAESLKLVERAAVAFGTPDAQPEWDLAIHMMRAYLLVELDRSAEAEKAFETGQREAERLGSIYLTWYPLGRARLLFIEGRWDDALAEIRAGQETLDALGTVRGLHTGLGLRSHTAIIEIHRRGRAARAAVSQEPYVPTGAFFDHLVLWAQALAWEADGHPEQALAALYRFWKHSECGRQQRGLHYLSPDIARLAVTVGEPEKARRVADDVERLADRQPTPTLRALHGLCRGIATANAGLLLGAADKLREAGRPLYHAYARESAAVVLAAAGRTAEARVALAAALELYDGLDAAWDAARAKARLREAGVRSRRTVAAPRARTGWDALTETERKVAALVAEGNSNPDIAARMFISRRTVQSHVSSILNKLDCTSRVELAVTAARHAGGQSG